MMACQLLITGLIARVATIRLIRCGFSPTFATKSKRW